MQEFVNEFKIISKVFGDSPTNVIRQIERELPQLSREHGPLKDYLAQASVSPRTLSAALSLKQIASQVNVMIHALGILITLPYILEEDEIIGSISLGAGNTGKKFDLITDRRVAEFKFIQWRGGAESIRQNSVFKDFLNLLWDKSGKRKQLFLNGTAQALSFLQGGRAIPSVLSRNVRLKMQFENRYGTQFEVVSDFYRKYKDKVEIIDLKSIIPLPQKI